MARPEKSGLDFFSKGTAFYSDGRIKGIGAAFGAKGFYFTDYLLCCLYGGPDGYFLPWGASACAYASDGAGCGIGASAADEIVRALVKSGYFSEELFVKYGILTSCEIQREFISRAARRKNAVMCFEFLLVPPIQLPRKIRALPISAMGERFLSFVPEGVHAGKNIVNVGNNPINVGKNPVNVDNNPINVDNNSINVDNNPINVDKNPVNVDNNPGKEKEERKERTKEKKEERENKRWEINTLRADRGDKDFAEVIACYSENIGLPSGVVGERLSDFLTDCDKSLILFAIEEAAVHNKRNFAYISAIINNNISCGRRTRAEAEAYRAEKREKKREGAFVQDGKAVLSERAKEAESAVSFAEFLKQRGGESK